MLIWKECDLGRTRDDTKAMAIHSALQRETGGGDARADAAAIALKHAIARQIEREMHARRITKTMMAASMRTSRAALNRLLDRSDTGLTLLTLVAAAAALDATVTIKLARR